MILGHCIALFLSGLPAHGAETEQSLVDRSFFVVPIALYTSDTGFGAGLAGFKSYHSDQPRNSSVQFSSILTTRKQFTAVVRLEQFFHDGNDRMYLNVSYQKFPTDFFGTGNLTDNGDPERYTPEKVTLETFYEWRFWRNLKLRTMLFVNNLAVVKTEGGRTIESGTIPYPRGRFDAGPGIGLVWDSRDNTQATTRGIFAALDYTGAFLEDEGGAYNSVTLDVRAFFHPLPDLVFGSMLLIENRQGDVPFYLLPRLGGQDYLRGYEEGRFLDHSLFLLQQDIRFPVWRFIGGAVFGAAGRVAPEFGKAFSGKFHTACGIGARIYLNREEHMVVRADAARGDDADGFYVTFSEAF